MADQDSPKGLFKLPQELRDQIYGYVLLKSHATITMLPHYNSAQSLISAAQPALCCANKQLRAETLPVFYNINLFLAEISDEEDLNVAKNWIDTIGDENLGHVHRLALCGWTMGLGVGTWLRMVINLKDCTMEGEQNVMMSGPDRDPPSKGKKVVEFRKMFEQVVEAKGCRAWDAELLLRLMGGFNALCQGGRNPVESWFGTSGRSY